MLTCPILHTITPSLHLPFIQRHVNLPTLLRHVPSCWQGLLRHSSISLSHLSPSHPSSHTQWNDPGVFTQVPVIRHIKLNTIYVSQYSYNTCVRNVISVSFNDKLFQSELLTSAYYNLLYAVILISSHWQKVPQDLLSSQPLYNSPCN